jgi:RNA polymerase sigma-70 factor (ECF subfamily)
LLDEDDAVRMDARIDAAAQSRRLYEAMDRLPEGERAVLELVALDGLSAREAGQALHIGSVAARVRLHRARRRLRARLDHLDLGPNDLPEVTT